MSSTYQRSGTAANARLMLQPQEIDRRLIKNGSRLCQRVSAPRLDRLWMAGRSRLFRVDDFFERILHFVCAVASHSRIEFEYCVESYRPGPAPGIDALYAAESSNNFRFVRRPASPLLGNSTWRRRRTDCQFERVGCSNGSESRGNEGATNPGAKARRSLDLECDPYGRWYCSPRISLASDCLVLHY